MTDRPPTPGRSRSARRRRSEGTILVAARELFVSLGYDRTTIRGVAARAQVDPALVMQYYGSKKGLFAEAAHWETSCGRRGGADLAGLPSAALDDLLDHMDGAGGQAAAAVLRSSLTHPAATKVLRDDVMSTLRDAVTALVGDDDEDGGLRASVFAALLMGLATSRYLLELEPVADASRKDLHRVVEPVLATTLRLRGRTLPPGPERGSWKLLDLPSATTSQ